MVRQFGARQDIRRQFGGPSVQRQIDQRIQQQTAQEIQQAQQQTTIQPQQDRIIQKFQSQIKEFDNRIKQVNDKIKALEKQMKEDKAKGFDFWKSVRNQRFKQLDALSASLNPLFQERNLVVRKLRLREVGQRLPKELKDTSEGARLKLLGIDPSTGRIVGGGPIDRSIKARKLQTFAKILEVDPKSLQGFSLSVIERAAKDRAAGKSILGLRTFSRSEIQDIANRSVADYNKIQQDLIAAKKQASGQKKQNIQKNLSFLEKRAQDFQRRTDAKTFRIGQREEKARQRITESRVGRESFIQLAESKIKKINPDVANIWAKNARFQNHIIGIIEEAGLAGARALQFPGEIIQIGERITGSQAGMIASLAQGKFRKAIADAFAQSKTSMQAVQKVYSDPETYIYAAVGALGATAASATLTSAAAKRAAQGQTVKQGPISYRSVSPYPKKSDGLRIFVDKDGSVSFVSPRNLKVTLNENQTKRLPSPVSSNIKKVRNNLIPRKEVTNILQLKDGRKALRQALKNQGVIKKGQKTENIESILNQISQARLNRAKAEANRILRQVKTTKEPVKKTKATQEVKKERFTEKNKTSKKEFEKKAKEKIKKEVQSLLSTKEGRKAFRQELKSKGIIKKGEETPKLESILNEIGRRRTEIIIKKSRQIREKIKPEIATIKTPTQKNNLVLTKTKKGFKIEPRKEKLQRGSKKLRDLKSKYKKDSNVKKVQEILQPDGTVILKVQLIKITPKQIQLTKKRLRQKTISTPTRKQETQTLIPPKQTEKTIKKQKPLVKARFREKTQTVPKSKIKNTAKSVLAQNAVLSQRIENKLIQNQKPSIKDVQQLKDKIETKIESSLKNRQVQEIIQDIKDEIIQKPKTIPKSKTQQTSSPPTPKPLPKSKPKTKKKPQTTKKPGKKPKPLLKPKIKKKPKTKGTQAYVGKVRVKGKFIPATRPTTKNRALKKAAIVADNTVHASIKAKKAKGKTTKQKEIPTPKILSKFRKSKSKNRPNVLVEKNRFRIDSLGEKRGITFKGITAKKGNKNVANRKIKKKPVRTTAKKSKSKSSKRRK